MTYKIQNKETGDIIDTLVTLHEAKKALENYENQDKKDGNYEPDFYEIVENQYSIYHLKEGDYSWSLKKVIGSKDEAIEELQRWADIDASNLEDEAIIVSLEDVGEGYGHDQNYYRVMKSEEKYLTRNEAVKIYCYY